MGTAIMSMVLTNLLNSHKLAGAAIGSHGGARRRVGNVVVAVNVRPFDEVPPRGQRRELP
ncbi:hypothetical protein ACFYTQ_16320 [Nocardia sp. NPDC004068]|uniref:hypothetical protein n=1 Tax=Nocardia sp. NPDC004068 TaxID=3364303 RepID=UPI0036800CE0